MIHQLKEILLYELSELELKELEEYLLKISKGLREESSWQANIAQLLAATILANQKI